MFELPKGRSRPPTEAPLPGDSCWAAIPRTSFDQFARHATVTRFLPLLAERFARQRQRAPAKIAGLHDDGSTTALFLCVHNAGRAQRWRSDHSTPGRGPGGGLVRRLRTRDHGQSGGNRGDGRTGRRHLTGIPRSVDRDRPPRRRGHQHGLRQRLPDLARKRYEDRVPENPAGRTSTSWSCPSPRSAGRRCTV
jgi:hypothetical protein